MGDEEKNPYTKFLKILHPGGHPAVKFMDETKSHMISSKKIFILILLNVDILEHNQL